MIDTLSPPLESLLAGMAQLADRPEAIQPYIDSLPVWTRKQLDAVKRAMIGKPQPLDRFWLDPSRLMSDAGMTPDPWQMDLLRTPDCWTLCIAARGGGKSQVAAALALRKIILEPKTLAIVISQKEDLAKEFFNDRFLPLWRGLGEPLKKGNPFVAEIKLSNGSRFKAYPQTEGIRGIHPHLAVIDEAARIDDKMFTAITGMLGPNNGRIIAISTPVGQQGFFFYSWKNDDQYPDGKEGVQTGKVMWKKIRVTADMCPRLTPQFLAEARQRLGERDFATEFFCAFPTLINQMFSDDDIEAAFRPHDGTRPLRLRRD